MIANGLEATLDERGWVAVDLPDPGSVLQARDRLLAFLRERALPGLAVLEDYHTRIDDWRHIEVLHELATFYWEAELGRSIILANLDLLRGLVGPDLHVQRHPYLRAVRPGTPGDAAPLHRDTYYGSSPYEVSVLVPFTEMTAESAIRVISGSHVAADSAYPYSQHVSPDVTIRSPKHRLGFPYAPRLLDPALAERAEPVPLLVGQALVFGLSLVHGHGVSRGRRTRFSSDIRVVNSLAPVSWSRGVRDDFYVPLCSSAVSRAARRYLAANEAEAAQRVVP